MGAAAGNGAVEGVGGAVRLRFMSGMETVLRNRVITRV